jgi:hypothetical protein
MSNAQAKTIVVEWNEAALEAIRVTHPGPPIVARALAVTHTCMYDAWAAYDQKAKGSLLGGALRRPAAQRTDDNRRQAMSFAAYRALTDLFPTEKASFDAIMASHGYNPADTSINPNTPAGVGNIACGALLVYRHRDGSNQLGNLAPGAYSDYTGYAPVNTPDVVNDIGRWQPLRLPDGSVQTFITPHWKKVKPFALTKYNQFPLTPPAAVDTEAFRQQALEVVAYSAVLNDQQKTIAEYWADGPTSELPPGHWTLFATAVSERDGHNMGQDTKMFMAVSNAQLDASIATWGYKVDFDYVRPVTAIRELFRGQQIEAWAGENLGTGMINGEDWRPYQAANVVTPPFAEYVSGHSTFSAAGAEVLKRFTGSDVFKFGVVIPAGSSRVEPGTVPVNDVSMTWATFTDAADEAGISRRYGGIHFLDGDLNGRSLGRKIGAAVWNKASRLFNGQ